MVSEPNSKHDASTGDVVAYIDQGGVFMFSSKDLGILPKEQ